MPQVATVGLGAGFRDDGAIGTKEEPAGFRRNLRAWNVLGYSRVKAMRRARSLNRRLHSYFNSSSSRSRTQISKLLALTDLDSNTTAECRRKNAE